MKKTFPEPFHFPKVIKIDCSSINYHSSDQFYRDMFVSDLHVIYGLILFKLRYT